MIITNARIFTAGESPQILEGDAILIQGDTIRAIQPQTTMLEQYPAEDILDAKGQLLMPASICAHTHFYGAYARGMAIPGDPPADFPQILQRLWWSLDKALDADTVRASALVMLVDAVKHGTTTLFDHHASPNHIAGSLDIIRDAVEQAGVRAVLCYEVTDRDGMDKMQAGIDENMRFIHQQKDHATIRGTFGLHASLTLNDETLRACADAVDDTIGFHIHVAEHEADEDDSLRRSNKRVVQRLDDYGIWRTNTIVAHAVHIDDAEREILRQQGVWVTHQPRSNMNNGVGAADIEAMLNAGIPLALGNDGFSFNMWAEWKAAYLMHKVVHRDPRRANGADIATMALNNNAKLAQAFFPEKKIGSIEEGAVADIILVDYHPFTPLNEGNLPWHLIFGFESSMITTTISSGKILMQDRQILTLNESEIMAEAKALAPALWEKYTEYAKQTL
jgi:putative selenium metabolism protein SsnA